METKNILALHLYGNSVTVTPNLTAMEGLIFLLTIKNKIK
jgi:hypothetical protein